MVFLYSNHPLLSSVPFSLIARLIKTKLATFIGTFSFYFQLKWGILYARLTFQNHRYMYLQLVIVIIRVLNP